MPSDGIHGSFATVTISPALNCTNPASATSKPASAESKATLRAADALPCGRSISTSAPRNEM